MTADDGRYHADGRTKREFPTVMALLTLGMAASRGPEPIAASAQLDDELVNLVMHHGNWQAWRATVDVAVAVLLDAYKDRAPDVLRTLAAAVAAADDPRNWPYRPPPE